MDILSIRTHQRSEMLDITGQIAEMAAKKGITNGLITVYVPHTTAAVTINENADPDVIHDVLLTLTELVPQHRKGYRHCEGNSDAHVKASLLGTSVQIMIEKGRLQLGTWQSVFFCEFDGPRTRQVWLHAAES